MTAHTDGERERETRGDKTLTDDVGKQQGKSQRNRAGAQSRTFPVTASVRFAEGEERSGEGGPG